MATTLAVPDNLPVVSHQDPVTNMNQQPVFSLSRSGDRVNYNVESTTNWSQSGFEIAVTVPSLDTIIDRYLVLEVPVIIRFTGTCPVGSALLQSGHDGLRAFTLQSNMANMTISLNGTTFNQNPSDLIPYLSRIDMFNDYSTTSQSIGPVMLDSFQSYESAAGFIRNPLNSFGDSTRGVANPRGCYSMQINSNNETEAEIYCSIFEPLMISPFYYRTHDQKGLLGIDKLKLTVQWNRDIGRFWSHSTAAGSVFTSEPNVVFQANPSLHMRYITPSPIYSLPTRAYYSHLECDVQSTSVQPLNPLASIDVQMNNIQHSIVASKLIIFARRRQQDLTSNDPDVFASIESLDITYDNKSGILSGASKMDLYTISRRHLVSEDYQSWSGDRMPLLAGASVSYFNGCGSLVVLDIPTDVPVDPQKLPGTSTQMQLRIKANIKNNSPKVQQYDLFCISCYEGVWCIYDKQAMRTINMLDAEAAITAIDPSIENIVTYYTSEKDYKSGNGLMGGSFFGDLWQGIKNIGKAALPIIAPILGNIAQKRLGMGFGSNSDKYSRRAPSNYDAKQQYSSSSRDKIVPYMTANRKEQIAREWMRENSYERALPRNYHNQDSAIEDIDDEDNGAADIADDQSVNSNNSSNMSGGALMSRGRLASRLNNI